MAQGFWFLALSFTILLKAQAQTAWPDSLASLPLLTLAVARADTDRNAVPSYADRHVRVAGRASVGADPAEGRLNFAIQSGGAGLVITGGQTTAKIAPGDSVVCAGWLRFRRGQLMLENEGYRVIPADRRAPLPVALRNIRQFEPYEGMLVSLEGTVVGMRRVPVGTVLMLSVSDSVVYALAFGERGEGYFRAHPPGEQVRVTGVLGQYDPTPPFAQGYQVYPASAADVQRVGFGTSRMRLLLLIGALLLAVAFGGIAFLLGRARRRLQRQLQSENRYRLLFDHTDDAVFLHEVVQEPEGLRLRFIAANAAASRMFGVPIEAFEVRPPRSFLQDASQAIPMMERLLRERRFTARVPMRTPSGRDLVVQFDAFLFEESGRRTVLTLLGDLTQRDAYERGLIEARERAEAFGRLQQSFAANMSHEIRTPLTGIIGFANLLKEDLTDEPRNLAEFIESGAQHLLGVLDSVLEMARLESQGSGLALTTINLAHTLRECTDLLTPVARQNGIELDVEAPEALAVRANANAFGRIVTNLVGNALKFTPAGGTVRVRLAEASERVQLTVSDTGIGMSDAFKRRLFEPFAQEHTGEERPYGGTGLGLALSLRLAQMLGGSIEVESTEGHGSTFTVLLPRTHRDDGIASHTPHDQPPTHEQKETRP